MTDTIIHEIANFEGLYELHLRNGEPHIYSVRNQKNLKVRKDYGGYLLVDLYKRGVRKTRRVHTIVADSCLPNPEGKACVDHIDENRANNNLSNLRRVTNSENAHNSSKKLGISWLKKDRRWLVRVTINGRTTQHGRFKLEDKDLAIARSKEVSRTLRPGIKTSAILKEEDDDSSELSDNSEERRE